MKILDLYSPFLDDFKKQQDFQKVVERQRELNSLVRMAGEWGIDLQNVNRWLSSPEYTKNRENAQNFVVKIKAYVKKIEDIFKMELPGELRLSPSLMQFDGFARYDRGEHTVWFGIDHPDADEPYLEALLAHELSHVYRDHQPEVWKKLAKPLREVSRKEYLEAMTPQEHLVSEGLATLFSQVVFPQTPLHVHHFYFEHEMRWCLENRDKIHSKIVECLKGDKEVWKFYEEGVVENQSPSRIHYFWAAQQIRSWLLQDGKKPNTGIIEAHAISSETFACFKV